MTERIVGTDEEVRKFGILFGVLAGVVTLYLVYRGSDAWPFALTMSGLFFGLGMLFQQILRPFYRAWMKFALILGWINTRVLLTIFFFLIMMPVGVLMRLFGKDFLDERIDKHTQSYWVKRDRGPVTRERYERLF